MTMGAAGHPHSFTTPTNQRRQGSILPRHGLDGRDRGRQAPAHTVVWPRPKLAAATPARPAWQHLILRWRHALVWLLLALACLIQLSPPLADSAAPNVLAGLALAAYLIFLGAWLADRATRR